VPCDLKVTGSSRGIGHWKQVRPPTIHPLGCGPSPDPAYAGYFVHRAALLAFESGHVKRVKKVFKSISTLCAPNKGLEGFRLMRTLIEK